MIEMKRLFAAQLLSIIAIVFVDSLLSIVLMGQFDLLVFARLAILSEINFFGILLMWVVPQFQFPWWVLGVFILEWLGLIEFWDYAKGKRDNQDDEET